MVCDTERGYSNKHCPERGLCLTWASVMPKTRIQRTTGSQSPSTVADDLSGAPTDWASVPPKLLMERQAPEEEPGHHAPRA
jgi:hypothetical protein